MSSQDWLSTTKNELDSFRKSFVTNQTWLDTIEREYQDYCSTHLYLPTNEDSDIESTTNDDSDIESNMSDDSNHESAISHESNNDFNSHVKNTINFDSACRPESHDLHWSPRVETPPRTEPTYDTETISKSTRSTINNRV